ncbi:MAG: prepilin-type N-terminal cleavage/methylation domain-containing protein [Candidatus Omnitrophica bacterium]|nr:prepilin-type N-terminal cleavage/methylation domain-containing protein [Candidatus Omnitrophota bacterium]
MLRRGSPRGFTLVELLVASLLLALIGGITMATLAAGVRVWRRTTEHGVSEQAALIAFAKLRRDLLNARRFKPIPFQGAYDQSTMALVETEAGAPSPLPQLGQAGYYLDGRTKTLCRSFTPYPLLRARGLREGCQPILEPVAQLRFSYFGTAPGTGEAQWHQRWEGPQPPLAVRIQADGHSTVVYLGERPVEEEPGDAAAG